MSDLIDFALVNETTKTAVLYTGIDATVDIVLVNNSGAPIGLHAGSDPSTLTFYLPDGLFTAAQLTGLQVSVAGWSKPLIDPEAGTMALLCTTATSWPAGAVLTFPVAGAVTTANPAPNFTWALAPEGLDGNVPPQVNARLAVMLPPTPGNLPLPPVLQVSLDNQGVVYCSEQANRLANQLTLTLKNVGETSISTGSAAIGTPRVVVSFVYGNTSGALAPDSADPHSAWSIRATTRSQPPRAPWTPPGAPTPDKSSPQWLFTPAAGNVVVLAGARTDSANVTFVFDQVVTNQVPGHTQMLVLCTGFAKDATTAYDDHLYVLDINKQAPPPTLGVLALSAPQPVVPVKDPRAKVTIPISWTTYGAASVNVLTSSASAGITNIENKGGQGLLAYGDAVISVDPPAASQAFFITVQALDTIGGYLGAAQYTAFLQLSYTQDPDGWVYPAARFGARYWTLTDYAYRTQGGSFVYGDPPDPPRGTGRLYTRAAAAANAPDGWRLPTADDWRALIAMFETDPYAALILGGASGLGAHLTGLRLEGQYQFLDQAGYYWTATAAGPLTQFRGGNRTVDAGVPWSNDIDAEFAVRYVHPA